MQDYKTFVITKDEIIPTAEKMKKAGNFLVMVHAFINKEGQPDISWDYAVNPIIESYHVIGEMSVPTVSDIFSTSASWPERELNELFGIEFVGLDMSQRLFLPEEMLDPEGKGQIMVTPLAELRKKNIKEEA